MPSLARLRECPLEFQERVNEAGGLNKFDEPNFRFIWGESHAATVRAGGVWEHPNLLGVEWYRGYLDFLVDGGEPCWLLQQWFANNSVDDFGNERFGSPLRWKIENYNEAGMYDLGGYPYDGRYITIFPLVWKGEAGGKKVTEHLPLSSFLIDFIIPLINMARDVSVLQKQAAIETHREKQEQDRINRIEASLRNATPALGEIRSAAALRCTSEIQKKVDAIEQHWSSGIEFVRQRGKGLSIN